MSTLSEIESAMIAQTDNLPPEVAEEISFTVKQAKTNIYAWKAHIVRSLNQDAARIDILESLEESSVLVILGYEIFAEKIPRKPNRLVWQTWHYLAHQCSLQRGYRTSSNANLRSNLPEVLSRQLWGPRSHGGRYQTTQDHHARSEDSQLQPIQR